jgi:flagellar assembly protein FliH
MSTSNKDKGLPPAGTAAPGSAPNSYTRFIPREELGNFSAWNPQTFEPPPVKQPADVGVRKPTLAERAAAELRQATPKSTQAHHASMSTGAGPAGAAAPRAAAKAQSGPSARRPIVGGVPGQEEPTVQAEPDPPPPPPPNVDALVDAARQAGYQDGYRNGLAALESYRQTQAAQMAAYMSDQVGALAADFHHRLESLEQQLAGRIAGVALELARQVVRSELKQRPDVVVEVAEQALGALLASAKQIVVRMHPEDHALAQGQLTEVLAVRGARLVPDANVTRGGCVVESDIAVVDATVEARWDRAAAAMGHNAPWNGGKEALEPTEVRLSEAETERDEWSDAVDALQAVDSGAVVREEGSQP